jgi:hypothetical protein
LQLHQPQKQKPNTNPSRNIIQKQQKTIRNLFFNSNSLQHLVLRNSLLSSSSHVQNGLFQDIASEAAQIVLIKNDLRDVYTAIHLSKKTFSRIRLNFIWALGYNLIAIPVASGMKNNSIQTNIKLKNPLSQSTKTKENKQNFLSRRILSFYWIHAPSWSSRYRL